MNKTKLLIFDLDGTLFRTETVDIKAVNNALALNGFPERAEEEILSLIGPPLRDICRELVMSDDEAILDKLSLDITSFEQKYIGIYGEIYEGVIPMLEALKKKGFTMCICSNGGEEYVTSICKKFNFGQYLDYIWYCREGITKSQAVGILKEKYNVDTFIMIGDRLSDIQAASDNGGISIGAAYGFEKSEAASADYTANSVCEIPQLVYDIFR